ncbi:bifunctional precorrin-2 dehydrogenase/sirohydrochlorin ferrochelatase [Nitrosopumilus sp.]|uniref:precorrin-2 dehydrogenase/sirohydrochlorin ferrochelatase family protein n=1 Tax=Nitrosopumilus sp. TaxID=2024843 RepID=UPI0026035BC4|nr:bifunctional precorrin-2 dehydrogenase/sirohydrochlorin ferrochelatase [Nitrosopumilus sp.]
MIVDLDLKGGHVILIGSGFEGMLKLKSLLTQDCKILVFSEESNKEIQKYVKQKKITFKKLKIKNLDFLEKYDPVMIMATTEDKELNRKIYEKAKAMNCYGYTVDDPSFSDFSHPSLINIENLVQIAISTKGKSPIMSKKIRIESEKIFKKIIKKEYLNYIRIHEYARDLAKTKIQTADERREFMYSLMDDKKLNRSLKTGKLADAKKQIKVLFDLWVQN